MTVRPYPFVALGVPLVLLLLFAFGPTVILQTGGMVADALGCAMPIDAAAGPCPFMGVDLATFLAVAVAFGYLAFFTFPTGTTLLGVWLLAARRHYPGGGHDRPPSTGSVPHWVCEVQ